jgi:hypothetical protein
VALGILHHVKISVRRLELHLLQQPAAATCAVNAEPQTGEESYRTPERNEHEGDLRQRQSAADPVMKLRNGVLAISKSDCGFVTTTDEPY